MVKFVIIVSVGPSGLPLPPVFPSSPFPLQFLNVKTTLLPYGVAALMTVSNSTSPNTFAYSFTCLIHPTFQPSFTKTYSLVILRIIQPSLTSDLSLVAFFVSEVYTEGEEKWVVKVRRVEDGEEKEYVGGLLVAATVRMLSHSCPSLKGWKGLMEKWFIMWIIRMGKGLEVRKFWFW